ncbi:Geranylgeranyl transferase type-2 subunit alpha [Termitomyces sp. T112]|nr:Geranylgeranyl transferase type-2 subunit alpha [Termitomyces sp. T112]
MHGVKRIRQSAQVLEAKRLREKAKLDDYLSLTQDVLSRKKSRDWSEEALQLTSRLLQVNPEFYTIWNYRRNIFLNGIFPRSSLEEINDLITKDLSSTMTALKAHPKVYWIWNHRRWCLENTPNGPGAPGEADADSWRKTNWDRELFVVEKLLDADPRNFHAWNYRRYVLASMPVPRSAKSELAYTCRKIEANISNFSAWHQRSKVLTSLGESSGSVPSQYLEEEFNLLRNAMYTDPSDQSVWIYHRWLMGAGDDKKFLENEIEAIQELLDEQPDSKWCMESIIHYKRLLLKKHPNEVNTKTLLLDCKNLLEQLEILDPARHQRYQDIGQSFAGWRV